MPRHAKLVAAGARIVDPAQVVDGVSGRPTAYVATRLMIKKGVGYARHLKDLSDVAALHGWTLTEDDEDPRTAGLKLGVRTVTISGQPTGEPPDAWLLLQYLWQEKTENALRGVDLDHVVSTRAFEPMGWEIPHPWGPAGWEIPHPDVASAVSAGLVSYGSPGGGGRQPIGYAGPAPHRRRDRDIRGRRPVVAILDTGCFPHAWFGSRDGDRAVVRTDLDLDGYPIGDTDPATDIEVHGDLTGPFDGSVDRIAGHGTFIAGLVHQACPDAEILSWRAIPAKEPLVESEWLTILAQVIELVRRHREDGEGGYPIDVLSLSMGYYHENASDNLLDPILQDMIDKLQQLGVVVVCSAGNDATDRECYPAAFAPWRNGRGPVNVTTSRVPLVSVGAQNPNTTDALFTNAGTWVRSYAPGAAIMSTMPPFEGGLDPIASTRMHGRVRESIDPDDFRSLKDADGKDVGGFGLWSGTSFAAPVIAGRIAADLAPKLTDSTRYSDSPGAARRRGWEAVEHVTGISPTE
jgi:hypothetical protein